MRLACSICAQGSQCKAGEVTGPGLPGMWQKRGWSSSKHSTLWCLPETLSWVGVEEGESLEHCLPDPWPGVGERGETVWFWSGAGREEKHSPRGCVHIGTPEPSPAWTCLSSSHLAGWGRWGLSAVLRFTGMCPPGLSGEEQLQREQWVTANQSTVHQQARSPSWTGWVGGPVGWNVRWQTHV